MEPASLSVRVLAIPGRSYLAFRTGRTMFNVSYAKQGNALVVRLSLRDLDLRFYRWRPSGSSALRKQHERLWIIKRESPNDLLRRASFTVKLLPDTIWQLKPTPSVLSF